MGRRAHRTQSKLKSTGKETKAEHEGRNQEVNAAGDAVDTEDGGSTLDRGRCHEARNLRRAGSLGNFIDTPEQEEAAREAQLHPEIEEGP